MSRHRHLQIVACAAPPVLQLGELVEHCKTKDWLVSVVLTPQAANWITPDILAREHHITVRTHYRHPHEPRPSEPPPAAILVAPATFNTINKWAAGIADTLALSVLCESLGAKIPIQAVACLTEPLRSHPAYPQSIERLTTAGVDFLDPKRIIYRGNDGVLRFSWEKIPI